MARRASPIAPAPSGGAPAARHCAPPLSAAATADADTETWDAAFPLDLDPAGWRRFARAAGVIVLLALALGAAALAPERLFRRDHEAARALAAAGQRDDAIARYELLERRRPSNPSLPFERANLLLARARATGHRADYLAADEAFRTTIRLVGYHRDAAAGRAEAALAVGARTMALEMLAQVRRLDPTWPRGRLLFARALEAEGDWEAAASHYGPLRHVAEHAAEADAALARILALVDDGPDAP